jgi:hypothetical protein
MTLEELTTCRVISHLYLRLSGGMHKHIDFFIGFRVNHTHYTFTSDTLHKINMQQLLLILTF